ncbi:MAG: carbonic anhydrase [Polyangiales bacterium]|jgi:carbonic anhydrase
MSNEKSEPRPDIAELLLEGNKRWVSEQLAADPDYFHKLAEGQYPHSLWIGCADSRVPANVITGTRSGDIFVHRNIANVVVHDDLNMLSVLQFAVEVLQVEQVIVCGHYDCGGVKAALTHQNLGLINKWLRYIKDVYRLHSRELAAYSDKGLLERRMVELNIIESVRGLAKTSIVQEAWARKGAPILHGWVYDLEDGILRDLGVTMSDTSRIEDIYRYNFET